MTNQLGLHLVSMPVPAWNQAVKQTYAMTPQYITIHNTANNASARAEISYMNGNTQWVSYHWAVDDVEAINAIPHNRNAWHCGDGNGAGNMASIGIEICYSLTPGHPRYAKAEENGAKLAALILFELGWGIDRIRKHQDWSGKYCPHRILDNGEWAVFKGKVQHYLTLLHQGGNAPLAEEQKEEEEKMKNFVVRSKSGKQGYVAVVNGAVFGIGSIDTVHQLQAAGAVHLNLDDGDFDRFIASQEFDDKKLVASVDKLTNAVKEK